MLGWPNEAAGVNRELMAEIEQANKLRAYQRGLTAEPTEQKASEYEERAAQLVSMQFGSEEEEAKAGDQELGPLPVTSQSQRKPAMGHASSMSTLYPNE